MDPSKVASHASDIAVLFVHSAVVSAMLWRFWHTRRPPTLVMAALPLGWILVALWDLDILDPLPFGLIRWLGVLLGAYVLYTLRPTARTA